jgi:hypothetical protein
MYLSPGTPAAERLTERTFKLSAGETSPPAALADIDWLAGHWVGEAFGGKTEELWMPPGGDSMTGVFRLTKDGKVVFYEIMTVVQQGDSLAFRLKHFNADLTGWEEKNEVQSFPLVMKRDGALMFSGMSFHPEGDKLTVHLAVEHKDKPTQEMTFVYMRARK